MSARSRRISQGRLLGPSVAFGADHDLVPDIDGTIQNELNAAEDIGKAAVEGQTHGQATDTQSAQQRRDFDVPLPQDQQGSKDNDDGLCGLSQERQQTVVQAGLGPVDPSLFEPVTTS